METMVVILVLLVLLVLFGGAGYFFVRETGWEHARLWFTAPHQIRQLTGAGRREARATGERDAEPPPSPRRDDRERRERQLGRVEPVAIALDDTALRDLREELQGELTRAAGLTREFDARLTRMEEALSQARHMPDEIGQSIREQDAKVRRRIEKLRVEINATKVSTTPFGQRRADALADLYSHLARVEAALAGVVNPILLPGEPLSVPAELFDDTLIWSNWNDVGERAYAFGEVFNQTRFVLEPEVADRIEQFISTFRQAVTGTVYPVLQGESRSPAQLAQVRRGLEAVIAALPPLRRNLEAAYRAQTTPATEDDEDE